MEEHIAPQFCASHIGSEQFFFCRIKLTLCVSGNIFNDRVPIRVMPHYNLRSATLIYFFRYRLTITRRSLLVLAASLVISLTAVFICLR